MIQIVQGTFGYWNGTIVVPKTSKDGPLELEPALEQRLVEKGVAKFVNEAQPHEDPGAPDDDEDPREPADPGEDPDDGLPTYDLSMKLDELKEIAAVYGVDASKMRSKADVVAAIDAVKGQLGEAPEDGDAPPVVDPAAAVV